MFLRSAIARKSRISGVTFPADEAAKVTANVTRAFVNYRLVSICYAKRERERERERERTGKRKERREKDSHSVFGSELKRS